MKIRGSVLSERLQKQVLSMFVHRYTKRRRPAWASRPDCKSCLVQFSNDAEWLANTFFEITKKGELSRRVKHCESYPTRPGNPELRGVV